MIVPLLGQLVVAHEFLLVFDLNVLVDQIDQLRVGDRRVGPVGLVRLQPAEHFARLVFGVVADVVGQDHLVQSHVVVVGVGRVDFRQQLDDFLEVALVLDPRTLGFEQQRDQVDHLVEQELVCLCLHCLLVLDSVRNQILHLLLVEVVIIFQCYNLIDKDQDRFEQP